MNKKYWYVKIADYLYAASGKVGQFEIHAIANTGDNGKYIIRDLKDIIHKFILDEKRFGFTYKIEFEHENELITNHRGYCCKITIPVGSVKDVKNFYRLTENPVIQDLRLEGVLFVFHMTWF